MRATRLGQLGVPAGVIAIIVMMVVPLPTVLLDMLLAANITGALLVLLVSMFVRRPLDFAAFPSLLLIATLFRLALNISVDAACAAARLRRQGGAELRPLRRGRHR